MLCFQWHFMNVIQYGGSSWISKEPSQIRDHYVSSYFQQQLGRGGTFKEQAIRKSSGKAVQLGLKAGYTQC